MTEPSNDDNRAGRDLAGSGFPKTDVPPAPISAESIMRIATGFMASKSLFVASKLGLFTLLADGPMELSAIASQVGAPPRTVRIIVDALVAVGLLERGERGYSNAPATGALLSGRGPVDLRPMLALFDQVTYSEWAGLDTAVVTGRAVRTLLSTEDQQMLSTGIEALTAPTAAALPTSYDFTSHRRVLDLGGGTGSFLRAVLHRHAHLSGTLMDMPAVAAIAREAIAEAGLADRIEVLGGDIMVDDIPPNHDAILIANVLHLMQPARIRLLLGRARTRIADGGRLLLVDLFTDPTHTQPTFAALMAGTFLVGYGEGDVYSEAEVRRWLDETGWHCLAHHTLNSPASLLVSTPA